MSFECRILTCNRYSLVDIFHYDAFIHRKNEQLTLAYMTTIVTVSTMNGTSSVIVSIAREKNDQSSALRQATNCLLGTWGL